MRLVFEKTHRVFYNEFIVQTEEFYDFFSDPRSDDLQVYFAHVYLRKKKGWHVKRGRGTRKKEISTFVSN